MKCKSGICRGLSVIAAGIVAAVWVAPTWGITTLSFDNISANSVGDALIGETQLFVDVADIGGSQVSFRFYNTGPNASSITDVYFEDGTLLGIATVINAPGVNFSQGASPGNLPSANQAVPPFVATAGFTADSDPPAQPNGVNPGEELIIVFDLLGGQTFADTEAALDLGGAPGGLRIGIHAQGFASGGSESFVNNPPGTPPPPPPPPPGPLDGVPEPVTTTLAMMGLGALSLATRRRSA